MTNLGGFEKKISPEHASLSKNRFEDWPLSQPMMEEKQSAPPTAFVQIWRKNIPWLIPWLTVLSSPSKWANKKKAGNAGKYHPLSSNYHPLLLMEEIRLTSWVWYCVPCLQGHVFYIPGAAGFLPSPVSSTENGQISHYHPTIWPNMAKFHQPTSRFLWNSRGISLTKPPNLGFFVGPVRWL